MKHFTQTGAVLLTCLIVLTATSIAAISQTDRLQVNLKLLSNMQLSQHAFRLAEEKVENLIAGIETTPMQLHYRSGLSQDCEGRNSCGTIAIRDNAAGCAGSDEAQQFYLQISGTGIPSSRAYLRKTIVQGAEACIDIERGTLLELHRTYWFIADPAEPNW